MSVDWNAVTAVSSAITTVIIAATVLVGYRQIRVAGQQVDHLRRATQLQGTMTIFEEMTTPASMAQFKFVLGELRTRMQDPQYREEVAALVSPVEADHPEFGILRRFEKLGTYVKNGLLEGGVLYDFFGGAWIRTWEALVETDVIELSRRPFGPELWENAELVYNQCKAYAAARDWSEASPRKQTVEPT
jgi:hypothetical protein